MTTSVAGTTATFTGAAAQPMACTFINKRPPPTISTTPSAGGPVGTSISDTATVSGGVTPTGTVTFNLFPPGNATCTGTPVFTSTGTLSGPAAPPRALSRPPRWASTTGSPPTAVTPTTPRSAPACTAEPVTITQATPAIATTPSAGGPVGTSISDTATVSGGLQPDRHGHLQAFPAGGHDLRRDPGLHLHEPAQRGPSATSGPFFATTTVGTYHWVATYNGDANNTTVSSGLRGRAGDHHPGHPGHRHHPLGGRCRSALRSRTRRR